MTPGHETMRVLVLALMLAIACACGGSGAAAPSSSPQPATTSPLSVIVHSDKTSNQGRPLRMLLRTVTLEEYLLETYTSVANLVITPDGSVLRSTVIFPGQLARVEIERPTDQVLAVYFLFSQPGEPWRMRIARTDIHRLNLYLGEDHILVPAIGPALGE